MTYHIERTDDMIKVTIAAEASATITLTENGWRELAEAVLEYIADDGSDEEYSEEEDYLNLTGR